MPKWRGEVNLKSSATNSGTSEDKLFLVIDFKLFSQAILVIGSTGTSAMPSCWARLKGM
jgi:hypothetical protein